MVTTDSLASFCVFHVFYTLVNSFNLMKQEKVDISFHRVCVCFCLSFLCLASWLASCCKRRASRIHVDEH